MGAVLFSLKQTRAGTPFVTAGRGPIQSITKNSSWNSEFSFRSESSIHPSPPTRCPSVSGCISAPPTALSRRRAASRTDCLLGTASLLLFTLFFSKLSKSISACGKRWRTPRPGRVLRAQTWSGQPPRSRSCPFSTSSSLRRFFVSSTSLCPFGRARFCTLRGKSTWR